MRNLYDEWKYAELKSKEWKRTELELRNEIVEKFTSEDDIGKTKIDDDGYEIEINRGYSQSLDESVLDNLTLSEEEQACIKYKPGLVAKELKKLNGTETLFEAIIEKPRQATLKITKDE